MKRHRGVVATPTTLSLVVLAVCAVASLPAQSFRGDIVTSIRLDGAVDETVEMRAGEVVTLEFVPDERFVQAVRIEVRLPREVTLPPGTFSVDVYDRVDSDAPSGLTTIAGRRLLAQPVAGAAVAISVPVSREGAGAPASVGTFVTGTADRTVGMLAFQLTPLSKGTAIDLDAVPVTVRVSTELRPVGALAFALEGEQEAIDRARPLLVVSIDGRAIDPFEVTELAPGIYRVFAAAGDYLERATNVGINQGELRTIDLAVELPTATVTVALPSVAELFWNGELVGRGASLEVEPGFHTVVIRLGDFSVTRRLELLADRSYEIGLDLDISVDQD